ncbi:TonB-dependent receptor [Steroidobacter agaridevorans]|uniref:TonB-dependent receptor n=1 Tax=Steroidobacter agaridevorans TaxID=2695856 RepID=A0A829YKG2_9GAMM|nr:TonB-dependent receptor [Steroidobacter agaridevorans]GFE83323.1 TonB-dependent receptor [Steroidobacter agaridevorans]
MANILGYRGQRSATRAPWAVATSVLFLQGWSTVALSAEPAELEEVVVTGIRAGLRSSLEVKRESIQVVDAISAEDIGDFPDKNLGEALQRITGVQINRQDGEGRGVSIRGAEPGLNRVEINGVTALSVTVAGGRDVDFRDLPVEFVSRLEVFKSSTPEMTEGGIGGTVRVITRRPLDSTEPYLAGSTQMVYSDLAKEYDPKFAIIGSRTFLNNTLGVLGAATYEERHLDSHNARTTGWLRRAPAPTGLGATPGRGTDVNGDGTLDWIPEIPRYSLDRRETKRPAFLGIVEWAPSDTMKVFAEGSYAKAREQVSSMLMQLSAASGLIDYENSVVGPDNTVTHLEVIPHPDFQTDLAYRNIGGSLEREQYTTAFGGEWNLGSFKLDGRVTYASAEVQNDEKNSVATIFGVPRAIVDYNNSEGAPNFTFPGIDTTTADAVNNLTAVFNPRTNSQEETSAQFNVEYLPESNWLTSIKTGVELRELTMDSILFQRTIQLTSRTGIRSSGSTLSIAVPQSVIQDIINSNSGVNDIRFFETGALGFGGIRYWNDNGDPTYDATIAASGLGNIDPHAFNPNTETNNSFQNYLDTWEVEEKTNAAYVQGSFKFDGLAIPISGTLGVRYVDTDTLSSGYNRIKHGPGDVEFPRASRDGGYSKWLPSLNLRFDLRDDLVGRMTAGKVLARPNPSQLAFRRSLDNVGLSGSRGNPALKPYEALQYDLGLEWYFSRDGFLSATAFRKEISEFVINTSVTEEADDGTGTVRRYTVAFPINGGDDVTINGIEAGAQYAFDFLPQPFNGFGALANVTYQKDEGFKGPNIITGEILPFPGLSRLSYNYSLYFENERFGARASYNWREKWLASASGRGGLPEFNEDFGSLDASLNYNILPQFTVFLEAINVLNDQRIEHNTALRRIANETYGSRYFLGVRARL